jgi:hypothetical protein
MPFRRVADRPADRQRMNDRTRDPYTDDNDGPDLPFLTMQLLIAEDGVRDVGTLTHFTLPDVSALFEDVRRP